MYRQCKEKLHVDLIWEFKGYTYPVTIELKFGVVFLRVKKNDLLQTHEECTQLI